MPNTQKKALVFLLLCISGILCYLFLPQHTTRYAVFAGYNADRTIHPYVITYLKGLKEVTDGIVYIADSELLPEEYNKLKGLVIHTEHKRHGEYDFGSYKRGFNWLKSNGYLENADELIFANDSCYAPITSFKPMFKAMSKRPELDFWGDLQNTRFNPHVQTYFIVFRKPVINSKVFANFLNNITHQIDSSLYITEYEVKLTPLLASHGYKWDSYMPYQQLDYLKDDTDKNTYPLTLLRDYNHQFLKRRTFSGTLLLLEDREDLLNYIAKNYPILYQQIITEHTPNNTAQNMKD